MSMLHWLLALSLSADAPTWAEAERWQWTGRSAEAIAAYDQLAADAPARAALGKAACQQSTGQLAAAERTLDAALAAEPKHPGLLAARARLAFARGEHERTEKLVADALAADEQQAVARWLRAELLRAAGRHDEAEKAYEWFIDVYNRGGEFTAEQLHHIGLGAAQYARWKRNSRQFTFLVNRLYPSALKLNEHYWPARLETARLFLEKFNKPEATNELNAALAINPQAAEVHVEKARLALLDFDLRSARQAMSRALELHPQLVAAQQLAADILLADQRPDEAIRVLEQARTANPRDDETLGRLAAAYGAIDGPPQPGSRMQKLLDEVTGRNARCGEFFETLAASFDLLRRYPRAAQYYEEAQSRMPRLIGVRGELGLVLMRLGDEARATELLKESFRIDPFNVRVKNMLEVLDVLAGYAVLETDHFVIRFDRGQDELLARYAARHLESVYPRLVRDLGFEPPGKSLFEIFNRARGTSGHAWFSARMVGLPFIGTVGACAGKMVAIASPNGMPKKFNWSRVLTHEFVHVVTLQQTNFNIPHWFTEALAVWHEQQVRPPEWTELLARRTRAGELYDLDSINLGFIRPKNGDDWTLAYCQAQLYAEFMRAEFGDDAFAKMLAAYRDHLPTTAAIRRSFGVEQPEFERRYRAYVDKIVAAAKLGDTPFSRDFADLQRAAEKEPDNADLQAELAVAHLLRQANVRAREAADAALRLRAKHPVATYVLARLHLSIGDAAEATRLLTETLDEARPEERSLALLAGLKVRAKELAEAERLYRLGAERFPSAVKWPKALAQLYLQSEDVAKLEPTLAQLAALEYDNLTLRQKLAQLAVQRNDHAAAERWATEGLQIDIQDAALHATLGGALQARKKHAEAAEEFEAAIALDDSQPAWQFALGQLYVDLKQPAAARRTLERLREKHPDYPGADVLLESLKADK